MSIEIEVIKTQAYIEFCKRLSDAKIADDGFYQMDIVPCPATPAYMHEDIEIPKNKRRNRFF